MQNTTIMPLVEAPADVVYIAAQIYLYHTPLFDKAVTLIRCLHPNATILICADMWKSADDWRATYEQKLADVSHMYIVPDGRLVGKGVWAEYEFLKHETAIYAVLGDAVVLVSSLQVVNEFDWQKYARVRVKRMRGGE